MGFLWNLPAAGCGWFPETSGDAGVTPTPGPLIFSSGFLNKQSIRAEKRKFNYLCISEAAVES